MLTKNEVCTFKSKKPGFSHMIWVIFLVVWAVKGMAQCPASIPSLADYEEVSSKLTLSGCLPMQAVIQNQVLGATNVRATFDYTGGPINAQSTTSDSIHRYTRPGSYTIVQIAEKEGKDWISCQTVHVGDTLAPLVKAIPCADGNIQLTFAGNQPTDYPTYQIDWGDTEIKGYTGFGPRIYYKYGGPGTYTIRIRGVHTPGQCRGATRALTYKAPESLKGPTFSEGRATDETRIDFSFENPLGTDLLLLKGSPDGAFASNGQLLDSSMTTVTSSIDLPTTVCFRLQPADSCLASLASKPVCVSAMTLDGTSTTNTVEWDLSSFPVGLKAMIQKDGKDWQDVTSLGKEGTLTDREFVCGNEVCYQLVLNHDNYTFYGLPRCARVPYEECVTRPPFYIPGAFSPNGDGFNDTFEVKGVISTEYEITLFNVWGNAVFRSVDPSTSWDGSIDGNPAQPGTYVYRIRYRNVSGENQTKEGAIVLMR